MPRPLTDQFLRQIETPPAGRLDIADEGEPGLMLRVLSDGTRTWFFRYRNREGMQRKYKIGRSGDRAPLWTLTQARKEARRLKVYVEQGGDPQGEKVKDRTRHRSRRGAPTFSGLIDDFVKDQGPEWRPSTAKGWIGYLEREIRPVLGPKPAEEVTADDIRQIIDGMRTGIISGVDAAGNTVWRRRPAPVASKRCFEVLRRLCVWAVHQRRIRFSPCDEAKPFRRRRRRDRRVAALKAYTDGQMRAIFEAARGTELEHVVAIVAHTGVRAHEARSGRWMDIDRRAALWRVPPELHKAGGMTGAPHLVPLSTGALAVLDRIREENMRPGPYSPWLFPAPTSSCEVCGDNVWPYANGHMQKGNKAAADIRRNAGVGDLGRLLHRFRDTIKTRMSEHGIDGRVSEHILGHIVVGIEGTYNHAEMLPQRREALEWWSGELARLSSPGHR